MGNYGCGYSSSSAKILDDFWEGLPIRKKTADEYACFIEELKQQQSITLDEFHLSLSKQFFVHPIYMIESQEIFDYILLRFGKELTRVVSGNEEANQSYTLFLIAMIFLCKVDSELSYSACNRIIKLFKVPINGDMLSKEILRSTLKNYVSIITIFPVTFLKNYSENPGQFESQLEEIFNPKIIDLYIKNILLSHINSNMIRLYKFFCRDYSQLTYDAEVRNELYELGRDQIEVNRKRLTHKQNATFTLQEEVKS